MPQLPNQNQGTQVAQTEGQNVSGKTLVQSDWFVDSQSGRYPTSWQVNDYQRDEGLLVLPVAGPVSTTYPRVIRVHAPYGSRTMRFAAAKRSGPPVVPSLTADTASGDKCLGSTFALATPSVGGANSQYDYAASGEVYYVQGGVPDGDYAAAKPVRGSEDDDRYQTGNPPFKQELFWAVINSLSGSIGGGAVGSALSGGSTLTKAQIKNDENWQYFATDFVGVLFSLDLVY